VAIFVLLYTNTLALIIRPVHEFLRNSNCRQGGPKKCTFLMHHICGSTQVKMTWLSSKCSEKSWD